MLVEDDEGWQQAISGLLEMGNNYHLVACVDHYEAAIEAYKTYQPDVVLLDWKINVSQSGEEKDGLFVGNTLVDLGSDPNKMVLISGSSSDEIPGHPFFYVPKSRIAEELLGTLEGIVSAHSLR